MATRNSVGYLEFLKKFMTHYLHWQLLMTQPSNRYVYCYRVCSCQVLAVHRAHRNPGFLCSRSNFQSSTSGSIIPRKIQSARFVQYPCSKPDHPDSLFFRQQFEASCNLQGQSDSRRMDITFSANVCPVKVRNEK